MNATLPILTLAGRLAELGAPATRQADALLCQAFALGASVDQARRALSPAAKRALYSYASRTHRGIDERIAEGRDVWQRVLAARSRATA